MKYEYAVMYTQWWKMYASTFISKESSVTYKLIHSLHLHIWEYAELLNVIYMWRYYD